MMRYLKSGTRRSVSTGLELMVPTCPIGCTFYTTPLVVSGLYSPPHTTSRISGICDND
ncbi:hypothetical protein SCLCIDRAFT_1211123, partial [Scleroderma citrinum Foug A]